MTTASPTTETEHVEFTTAREFFDPDHDEQNLDRESADPDRARYAKGCLFYDQSTPLFYCCDCHEHVAPLKWAGDEQVPNYDEVRAAAFRRLFEESPRCDVCAGNLPEKVDR